MTEMTIDFGRCEGTLKALHGVNNGPVCYGELLDVSHYYEQAHVPLVRLHDPNWPYPREVDIHTIFPDFDKDPEDPASYDFSYTDAYIRSVLDTGAKIVYRLGESIEHTRTKHYVHPPRDYEHWARICLGIIRHYNHGWADGFHYHIEYWEIWNEPDNSDSGVMWSGTAQQYYELYRTAATAIKAFDPGLKVGGYAACRFHNDYMPNFMAYCRKYALPLDFFSWHTYTTDIERIKSNSRFVRGLLDEHGYTHTESHLNEWNYLDLTDWKKKLWAREGEAARRSMFERAKSIEGAAFAASVLLELQDCPVDQANYYDGQPTALLCGLFDYYGLPQKTYYAFEAFGRLLQHPLRAHAEAAPGQARLSCCAGKSDSGSGAALISYDGEAELPVEFRIQGASDGAVCNMYVLDSARNLEPSGEWLLDRERSELYDSEASRRFAALRNQVSDPSLSSLSFLQALRMRFRSD